MQPLRFTRHARSRMRRDKLAQADVAAVLSTPDAVAPTTKDRVNAWKRLLADGLK
jgi:hypothetical protein